MSRKVVLFYVALLTPWAAAGRRDPPSPLAQYVEEAMARASSQAETASSGSLWSPQAPLADLARDRRAFRVDDLVTVLIADRASATSRGVTQASRSSAAKGNIESLWAVRKPGLSNLARFGGESSLDGQGTTSRETVLLTTLSARVTHVLPNGNLVVEGVKETVVNSERQVVTVRGVVRPIDLDPANQVRSDRLAMLEVRVNGKGVVGDAIRRPMLLYRLLMGLLPF
jgi:flagellar L-ring protein precursor FlgH